MADSTTLSVDNGALDDEIDTNKLSDEIDNHFADCDASLKSTIHRLIMPLH